MRPIELEHGLGDNGPAQCPDGIDLHAQVFFLSQAFQDFCIRQGRCLKHPYKPDDQHQRNQCCHEDNAAFRVAI